MDSMTTNNFASSLHRSYGDLRKYIQASSSNGLSDSFERRRLIRSLEKSLVDLIAFFEKNNAAVPAASLQHENVEMSEDSLHQKRFLNEAIVEDLIATLSLPLFLPNVLHLTTLLLTTYADLTCISSDALDQILIRICDLSICNHDNDCDRFAFLSVVSLYVSCVNKGKKDEVSFLSLSSLEEMLNLSLAVVELLSINIFDVSWQPSINDKEQNLRNTLLLNARIFLVILFRKSSQRLENEEAVSTFDCNKICEDFIITLIEYTTVIIEESRSLFDSCEGGSDHFYDVFEEVAREIGSTVDMIDVLLDFKVNIPPEALFPFTTAVTSFLAIVEPKFCNRFHDDQIFYFYDKIIFRLSEIIIDDHRCNDLQRGESQSLALLYFLKRTRAHSLTEEVNQFIEMFGPAFKYDVNIDDSFNKKNGNVTDTLEVAIFASILYEPLSLIEYSEDDNLVEPCSSRISSVTASLLDIACDNTKLASSPWSSILAKRMLQHGGLYEENVENGAPNLKSSVSRYTKRQIETFR